MNKQTLTFPITLEYSREAIKKLGITVIRTAKAVNLTFPEGWYLDEKNHFFDQEDRERGLVTWDDGGYVHVFPRFRIEQIISDLSDIFKVDEPIKMAVYDKYVKKGVEPLFVAEHSNTVVAMDEARNWLVKYVASLGIHFKDTYIEDKNRMPSAEDRLLFTIFNEDPLFAPESFWE